MSGMTYVSPASQIVEVLMFDKFRQQRAEEDAELLEKRIKNGFPPEGEFATNETEESDAK